MPTEEALPEPLRSLALRNAVEVSNSRFSSDVDRILDESDSRRNLRTYISSRRTFLYWLLGGVAAVAIVPMSLRTFWVTKQSQLPNPSQPGWRYCQKCQCLFFDGFPNKGVCTAGGNHSAQGFNFVLPQDVASNLGQTEWRFCEKCNSMFFNGFRPKVFARPAEATVLRALTSSCRMTLLPTLGSRTGGSATRARRCSSTAIRPRASVRPAVVTTLRALTSFCRIQTASHSDPISVNV
jgi:hypothetical protein